MRGLSLLDYRIKLKLVIIKEAVKIHVEFYSFLCIIEVVKDGEGWLDLEELKALVGE